MDPSHSNPQPVGEALEEVRERSRGSIGAAKALFFLAAGLSFVVSVGLFFTGDRERGIYVGLWVPSILSAGGLLLAGQRHD